MPVRSNDALQRRSIVRRVNSDVLVTAVATIVAALGAVWLTQRHAGREAHQARVEARRDAQRRVISELVIAGREKAGRFQILLPAFHKFSEKDHLEFIDTDSGRELRHVNSEVSRTLVQASLLVGDSQLLEAILKVRSLDMRFADEASGPALDKEKGFDGLLEGLRYVSQYSAAVSDLELTAAEVLRAPLVVPDPWSVRAARRVKARLERKPKAVANDTSDR